MIDLIERIGPILGIVAFLGLAILAFLIFQQAREVRRLREWAGRAPERAIEASEASQAAAEARGEVAETEPRPGFLARLRDRLAGLLGPAWEALDRRSPVDPRFLLIPLAAAVVAVGVLTGGFGLLGDDGGRGGKGGKGGKDEKPEKVEVAVLNATQVDTGGTTIAGVPGLASTVADDVVKPAGFKPGEQTDAASGLDESVIQFEPGSEQAADELARAIEPKLGETAAQPMIEEVRDLARGAPLALLIGQDDAELGGGSAQ